MHACSAGASREAALAASKDVQQRVGTRGALSDFIKLLCNRLTPSLICSAQLTALLALAKSVSPY